MINPDAIPQYTGNLPQLEQDQAALRKDAGKVRQSGADIHSRFQWLSAYTRRRRRSSSSPGASWSGLPTTDPSTLVPEDQDA